MKLIHFVPSYLSQALATAIMAISYFFKVGFKIRTNLDESEEEDTFTLNDDNVQQHIAWEMRPWYQYDGEVGVR